SSNSPSSPHSALRRSIGLIVAWPYVFVAPPGFIMPGLWRVGTNAVARFAITLSGQPLDQRDVKPNQPSGFPQDPRTGYDELGLGALAKVGRVGRRAVCAHVH